MQVENMIKSVVEKVRIRKETSIKTLQHIFTTHSLENRMDLWNIQSMMKPESSKTTGINIQITKGY